MAGNGNHYEEGNSSRTRPHKEFLELCAISTTGELTESEQARLREHLAACSECREALAEFESVADIGAPLLLSKLVGQDPPIRIPKPTEVHEAVSVSTLKIEESKSVYDLAERGKDSFLAYRKDDRRTKVNWDKAWLPLVAAGLLAVTLGIYAYQIGQRHASQIAQTTHSHVEGKLDALEQQLSDAGHQREILKAQLAERYRMIRELQRQIRNESAALSGARNTQANLERSLQNALSEKQQLAQRQTDASQNLDAAQASLQKIQAELDSVRQHREQDELRAQSLEAQITDLNAQLKQSQETVGKQEDLLADDRDIRDLMGARDLYIAEVYDVGRDGATQKPYGRVFYTKGRSLVFYAYDLDQQTGVKDASTFQAWGQNGPDRQRALSLGIFYQDSVTKKRWVLKFDDPRALEQINAVFVTVEPHGGSHKPSGKSLLFALLRTEPNNP